MREEIACRLSRPPKDYTNHLTYEDSRSSLQAPRSHDANPSIKRWRILASVASFGNNTHRKISNHVPFEETRLYESIITNDVYSVRYWLSQGEDVNQRSMEGWSYLHLAVAYNVSPGLLSLLLTQLSPAERDCDGVTPLELSMTTYKNSTLTTVFLDVITGRILGGDLPPLQALAQDGWQCWPDQDYLDTYLQPHITPHMTQFLSTVSQFLSDVREVHQAAMLHQEVDCSLAYVLDTEAGVTSLDSAGLSLVHICVIFYNIKLLSQLLQTFPFIANIRDSVGRTPLHYAACLNDDDYMYTLLRTAKARDDAEDVLGMRPGDYYMMDRQVIVSPTIQEMIRDKVHHPVVLQPPWPTCLLSASMEGCKVSEAIKTSDVNTLDALLADLNTDLTQRDCQGQGFLHQALHTGTDLPIFTVLLDRVDIAIRDLNGNTIMDLIVSGFHPEELKDAVEKRVRELIAGDEKKGEAEADRLLLAGWSHWPLAIQDTGETSTQSDQMLDRLLHLKAKVAAVHTAVHEGRSEELPGLLDHELLATAADQTGLPPLHKAVLFKRWHMVQYLVCKFPSTLTTTDNMGRTALHYAAALTTDGDNMYRTLRQAGADPTATDWMGLTPRDYWLQPQAVYLADTVKRMKALLDTPMAKEEETARPDETTYSEFIGTAHFLNSETPTADQQMPLTGKTISSDSERAPAPTSEDGKYITKYLGQALTLALAEIVQKQPSDPIEYLGQWLYRNHKAINDSGQIQI
ncbi:uncharacterized protein LOC143297902 [Babylonia areolata]|uniref:uncharacterized protein LOC143297902 n=1 Tax=Babylonia areolata TaxID=304850 RepID=UPI003FD55C0F